MSLMREEIRQQPNVLDRTLRLELRNIEKLKKRLAVKPPRMIVLAARGTSDNAALFGRYLLEIATGIPVSLAAPSIFTLYGANLKFDDLLVVAISQSGESTDTNLVLEKAKAGGAFTIGITNESASALAELADHVFLVRAGREKSVAATKTYTGQLLALYMIAYALGANLKTDDLRHLPQWAYDALRLENEIRERAGRYRFMNHAVVVGRGVNYSNAYEFALKMMETCYVVAERFSSADFLHGPIAMVEQSFPIFLFGPGGVTWPSMVEMRERLVGLRAETLMITDASNRAAAKLDKQTVVVIPAKLRHSGPLPDDLFTPIPYIVPAQLFAASLAVEKGFDPDKPRTLSKVTRTL
ncbi:MAG: SIS domain-containing protein [Acidobacteria bacterium]|nr:SIS domain-containing protein [Acidobacteriota bacterium]